MTDFYWKRRTSHHKPDYYINNDGRIVAEIHNSTIDDIWHTRTWSTVDQRFITLGDFISEEQAKMAIEKYWNIHFDSLGDL